MLSITFAAIRDNLCSRMLAITYVPEQISLSLASSHSLYRKNGTVTVYKALTQASLRLLMLTSYRQLAPVSSLSTTQPTLRPSRQSLQASTVFTFQVIQKNLTKTINT